MNRKTQSAHGHAQTADPRAVPQPSPPRPQDGKILVGSVDVLNAREVSGWAWEPSDPAASVVVELLDDDQVIATATADEYRVDLLEAGIGTGRYGFSLRGISVLLPRICHRLTVRRAIDGLVLRGAPRWIINEEGEPGSASKLLKDLTAATIVSAREPHDIEAAIAELLGAAQELANKHRQLAAKDAVPGGVDGRALAIEQKYPRLDLPDYPKPLVSIVIPVYNNFSLTYNCLTSIVQKLPVVSFEIIIVDDGSNDDTLFAKIIFGNSVRVTRMPRNSGFVSACNHGAELARGELLFFLNNDTLVEEAWLDELVATFEHTPNVGIVGSRLLDTNGLVQDAGGIVWRMGDAWNWGRGSISSDPRFTFMRDVDYVSGAALMIPTALFRSLGGFDTLFEPAYYEDTDLAFRVRSEGRRVVIQPASQVTHIEGASAGVDTSGSGMKRFQVVNRRKFHSRWRDTLANHRQNSEAPALEAERGVSRRAYFIDDTTPTPDQDAGSNAAVEHMRALIALGYKITFFASDNMARVDPYTRQLERYGIECSYAPFANSVEQVFRETRVHPNLIYFHRLSNAVKYVNLARHYFKNASLIYNVADLHFLRIEREAAHYGSAALAEEAEVARAQELSAMSLVDHVIVHSRYEAEVLQELAPKADVNLLAWTVRGSTLKTPIAERRGVAFVGGFRHRPNVDAAIHLVRDIMHRVRSGDPSIKCVLVGSMMPDSVSTLASQDVEAPGFMPDLKRLYERVRCTVAPLRYGAGIKGKVLDSLAHGTPCVMSPIAAEGLGLPKDLEWLIAADDEPFARKILALHADDSRAAELSEAGLVFIRDNFGAATIKAGMSAILAKTSRATAQALRPGAENSKTRSFP